MANPQPTDAHLRIAHSIQEQVMVSDFSKRQRKILDLILRLSWGCGKKDALIPHQNNFELVGVHETDIKTELEHLVNCKVIEIGDTYYSFNKNYDQWRVSLSRKFTPEKLGKLLSLNLNELGKTQTPILVKHKESTLQNTKIATPELASPKESNKENIKKDIYILPDFIDKELWDAFLEMRRKIKKPVFEKARELWIKDLEKLKATGDDPNEVLRRSIKNNWQGLFPLKKDVGEKGVIDPDKFIKGKYGHLVRR